MSVKPLFQPLKIGSLTLKNRILMAPMTRSRSSALTGVPNDLNLEYYKQRTNAGLIITEGVLVTPQGTEWPWAPGIWSKDQITAWKKITAAVHEDGSLIFCQLWHLGRVNHPDMPQQIASGEPVWGPSAIAAKGGKFRHLPGVPGYVTPEEIPDPQKIVELYKQAAINAKEAGFDGVELLYSFEITAYINQDGAGGYLPNQFLDTSANQRTDKWGGSVENRSRFGLEVLKALTEVWGPDRVGVKLSPVGGFNDTGMPLQDTLDTFSYFITEADKLNLAYIAVMRHLALFDPAGRGTVHDVVESYGHLIKKAKRVFNAGYTAEEAATTISEGKADAIAFGMPFITHPDLAKRLESGKTLENALDFATLYGAGGDLEAERKGYVDYPAAKYD